MVSRTELPDECPGGCGRPIREDRDLCWRCMRLLPRSIRWALNPRNGHREIGLMCAGVWISQNLL